MNLSSIIPDALMPHDTIGYYVSQRLKAEFPDRYVMHGAETGFDLDDFAAAGQCTLSYTEPDLADVVVAWHGPFQGINRGTRNAWCNVLWQGHHLRVLVLSWDHDAHYFLLADTVELAEAFYLAVCTWDMNTHGEVLVWEHNQWSKNEELYADIKCAAFANLILDHNLKDEIHADVARFFASRAVYESFGVPWKRGLLFIGPPGNGKTHAVKAVINEFSLPCLYVRDLVHDRAIRRVFEQARRTAPCILVLEDIESLVKTEHRSELLNELDGFAANTGLLTLATTNHPEKLDPALIHRPSRFDRAYHFELPSMAIRHVYISRWNDSLQPALRIGEAAIREVSEGSEGFSFAFLKELFVSSTMRWMAGQEPGGMDGVIYEQLALLRRQLKVTGKTRAKQPALAGGNGNGRH